MKKIKTAIVHAFTYHQAGGNPAGVVLNSDELTFQEKMEVASKVGLSETAFVSSSRVADVKLEFFTPTMQIPHCGHATIATFSYLRDVGLINVGQNLKETIDGQREVMVMEDRVFMEQLQPKYIQISKEDEELVLKSFGIGPGQMANDLQMEIVNTGNSFLIIPLRDEAIISNLTVDLSSIESISKKYDLIGFYPFIQSTEENFDADARMFAPYYGINEESATGMAAGPLACYLYDRLGRKQRIFKISQGRYMNPPSTSEITVEIESDQKEIKRILAGGTASLIKTLELAI